MSETHDENRMEDEGGTAPEPQEEKSWQMTQADYDRMVQNQQRLEENLNKMAEYFQEDEEEEYDPEEAKRILGEIDFSDPEQLIQVMEAVADSRVSGITPFVQDAAKERGKQRMNEAFDRADPSGKAFDRDLAGRLAEQIFNEQPEKAKNPSAAIYEAMQLAKQYQKPEPKRAPEVDDLPISGGARPGRKKFSSYDEVQEFHEALARDTGA